MALTVTVDVPPRDRQVLASWLRSSSIRAGLAQRARIVLLAADGLGTGEWLAVLPGEIRLHVGRLHIGRTRFKPGIYRARGSGSDGYHLDVKVHGGILRLSTHSCRPLTVSSSLHSGIDDHLASRLTIRLMIESGTGHQSLPRVIRSAARGRGSAGNLGLGGGRTATSMGREIMRLHTPANEAVLSTRK